MSIPDNSNKYIVTGQLDHLEDYGESVQVVITFQGHKVLGTEVKNDRERIIFNYAFGLGWLICTGYELEELDVHLERLPLS